MADVKVLAKQTQQITVGKKDRAGAVVSNQRRFLPKMRTDARYPGELAGIAKPCFTRQAVNTAFSGTKPAGLQAAGSFCSFTL